MKKIPFLFIFLLAAIMNFGQSHTYKAGCRYFKPPPVPSGSHAKQVSPEGFGCPACGKEKEDEQKAKQAEDLRRLNAEGAAQKAKIEKDKAAALAKHEADIKARQTETAKITISEKKIPQAPTPTKTNLSKNNAKNPKEEGGMLYNVNKNADWGTACGSCMGFGGWEQKVLIRENGDTVRFTFDNFYVYAQHKKNYCNKNFPQNTALLALFDKNRLLDIRLGHYMTFDIIDGSGKRYFNEENIFVIHLWGNYFLKMKKFASSIFLKSNNEMWGTGDIKVVNIKSREEIQIGGDKQDIYFPHNCSGFVMSELDKLVGEGQWLSGFRVDKGYKKGWDFIYIDKAEKVKTVYVSHEQFIKLK